MKKFLFFALLFFAFSSSFATLRRVNNNPGVVLNSVGPAFVYADFNSALSAVPNAGGDTIYLEPSDISYGGAFITKKIVLIGSGYLLDKNPNTPADKKSTKCGSFTLDDNTASPFNSAAGTVFKAEIGPCL